MVTSKQAALRRNNAPAERFDFDYTKNTKVGSDRKAIRAIILQMASQKIMKLLSTIASLTALAFILTPLTFGAAGDFMPVTWSRQDPIAKFPVIPGNKNIETALVNSLIKVLESRPDEALKAIDAIIAENPNFRLAYLIKGDLLLAHAHAISTLGNTNKAGSSGLLADMREEAKVRFARYLNSPPLNLAPQSILQMSSDQPYALVVDTDRSRLYVYQNQNGQPQYVTDYYISSGKNGVEKIREGDQKTPIGIYEVSANVPKTQLTDFYGPGALSLSYPNEWDQMKGRKGHGIWFHGTPAETYSRPPRSTNGCIVLANQDLVALAKYIRIGTTPVIINSKAEWVDVQKRRAERDSMLASLETWRQDWESRDVERYLSHYSKYFRAESKDLAAWSAQKRSVNYTKNPVKVDISNVSMYAYPGTKNVVVVSFDQDYKNNNLVSQTKKRQYWLHEGNRWQIVFEGDFSSSTNLIAKR